jgi:hypothetical protein
MRKHLMPRRMALQYPVPQWHSTRTHSMPKSPMMPTRMLVSLLPRRFDEPLNLLLIKMQTGMPRWAKIQPPRDLYPSQHPFPPLLQPPQPNHPAPVLPQHRASCLNPPDLLRVCSARLAKSNAPKLFPVPTASRLPSPVPSMPAICHLHFLGWTSMRACDAGTSDQAPSPTSSSSRATPTLRGTAGEVCQVESGPP